MENTVKIILKTIDDNFKMLNEKLSENNIRNEKNQDEIKQKLIDVDKKCDQLSLKQNEINIKLATHMATDESFQQKLSEDVKEIKKNRTEDKKSYNKKIYWLAGVVGSLILILVGNSAISTDQAASLLNPLNNNVTNTGKTVDVKNK